MSAWWMWSAWLLHGSLSHSRDASTTQRFSRRSSAPSAYRIAHAQQGDHSTLRAVAYAQFWKMGWLEVWVGCVPSSPILSAPSLRPCSSSRSAMDIASHLNLPLTPPNPSSSQMSSILRTSKVSHQLGITNRSAASHREVYDTSQRLCWPSIGIL